jgi:hypothetical protein
MKDISIFEGVVTFEAEGLTYNAIWKGTHWDMATLDQRRVVETHEVVLPRSATPKELIKAWWKEQKKAGTYTVPPDVDVTARPGWQGKPRK